MATATDVMTMLRPNGGWVVLGPTFQDVQCLECSPVTESEFNAGFAKYDSWKAEQDAIEAAHKAQAESKLEALGLTVADLKALGL